MTLAARKAFSESHAAIQALSDLVRTHGISGVNLWHSNDDNEQTFTVEAGINHVADANLSYALMKAAGKMPTNYCPKCDRDKPLCQFGKNKSRIGGLAAWCDVCNRRSVKRSQPVKGRRANPNNLCIVPRCA